MSTWGAVHPADRRSHRSSTTSGMSRKNGESRGQRSVGRAVRSSGRSRRRRRSYNFDVIPTVTSRYPLWDVKSPELTADVPHSRHGDERNDVALGGKTRRVDSTTT